MAQNVEIKAKVNDPASFEKTACLLTQSIGEIIHQTDTFFTVPQGRLKLRDFGNQQGELIRYHRPDAGGPKVSDYAISPTNDPNGLADLLAAVLPVLGVVRKKRTLYLSGRTRIHLDEVHDLGWFMELEVVLSDGESIESGELEILRLMESLGIKKTDLVEGAYLDLILARMK